MAEDQSYNFMRQFGERATESGYNVIPVEPHSKSPGRYSLDRWYPEHGWTRFCERQATEEELKAWAAWPGCGIGFACGNVVGIDIDLEEFGAVASVRALAKTMLGDTPLIRYGRYPRAMLLYRADVPFPSVGLSAGKAVATYASGRQFVGWGIHPITNDPYFWEDQTPADVPLEELPVVTEARVREFISQLPTVLTPDQIGRQIVRGAGEVHHNSGMGDEPATIEALRSALAFVKIDATDPYDYWVSIGMAIHAGSRGSADGLELWDQWSSGEARYEPGVCTSKWNSFSRRRDGVSAGTIFAFAAKEGWTLSDGMFLFEREAKAARLLETGEIDLSAIEKLAATAVTSKAVATKEAEAPPTVTAPAVEPEKKLPAVIKAAPVATQEEDAGQLPKWWADLDGGLRLFVDACTETARKPQPWLSLAAGLSAFATAAGRRYAGPTGVRPNLYMVGLAGSSSGKNHPLIWSQEALVAAGLHQRVGGNHLASGIAIISRLETFPTTLFAVDEIDELIRAATNKDRAPRHLAEINKFLLTLYTSSHAAFNGTEYANKKEKPTVRIEQPSMSLFGVCTPDAFWGSLKSGAALDGTLGRMLIFETDQNYPYSRDIGVEAPIPASIVEILAAIDKGVPGHNHFPAGDGAQMKPNPYRLGYASNDAKEYARALSIEETDLCRANHGRPIVSLLGRTFEQVQKLALIKAVARDPEKPQVRLADLEWGRLIYNTVVERMKRAIEDNIADTDHEVHVKAIAKIIRDATRSDPENGATSTMLATRYQKIQARMRRDIIDGLVEGGQVEVLAPPVGSGRPTLRYRWTAPIQ